MDIEKLYQDVWARVFAKHYGVKDVSLAAELADYAAHEAVMAWNPATMTSVIAAKARQS